MTDSITTLDEYKFTNQNWKKILDEISNYAPNKYGRGKNDYGEDHPLVKHLEISPHDLELSMMFLEYQGLIEYDKTEGNGIILTSKGFDVALQNQNAKKANKNFMATLYLSFVIAIVATANLLMGIDNITQRWAATLAIAIAFIGGGITIKKWYNK